MGFETENRDLRPDSRNRVPQDEVAVGLQLADLNVVANSTIISSARSERKQRHQSPDAIRVE